MAEKKKMEERKTQEWINKQPLVSKWHRRLSMRSTTTANLYAYNLQRFLADKRKETPKQFLDLCKRKFNSPKRSDLSDLWTELRDQAYEYPASTVLPVIRAFRNFVQHHGIYLPPEKLTRPRPQRKKDLTYDEVKQIISLCPEPYRTIFTIFSYAPMGEKSFVDWNKRDDMARNARSQLNNSKLYIKVEHAPRKNASYGFISLIPKKVIQSYLDRGNQLPFKNSQGNLIQEYNLQKEWKSVREGKAGFKDHKGVGAHEIRDAWFTWAGTPQGGKVDYDYRKFAIGHSQFSEQEYNKLWTMETENYNQLKRAWDARDTDPLVQQKIAELDREQQKALEERQKTEEDKEELKGLVRDLARKDILNEKRQKLLDQVMKEGTSIPPKGMVGMIGPPIVSAAQIELDRIDKELAEINKRLEALGKDTE